MHEACIRYAAPTLQDLETAGAPTEGYAIYQVYRDTGCNPSKLVPEHPDWYLWLVGTFPGGWIDYELVDTCAQRKPADALAYAATRLSLARLDWCAEWYPHLALKYSPVRLTDFRFAMCARANPQYAVQYAYRRLDPEQRKQCEAFLNKGLSADCPTCNTRNYPQSCEYCGGWSFKSTTTHLECAKCQALVWSQDCRNCSTALSFTLFECRDVYHKLTEVIIGFLVVVVGVVLVAIAVRMQL